MFDSNKMEFTQQCLEALKEDKVRITKNVRIIIDTIFQNENAFSVDLIALDILKKDKSSAEYSLIHEVIDSLKRHEIIFHKDGFYAKNHEILTSDTHGKTIEVNPFEYNLKTNEAKIIKAITKEDDSDEALRNKIEQLFGKKYETFIDAYFLLQNSSKVHEEVKKLLRDTTFIDVNPKIIYELAKIFFYCDNITLNEHKFFIEKRIETTSNETSKSDNSIKNIEQNDGIPKIDKQKFIFKVLRKIKYNRLREKDIQQIGKLKNIHGYEDFYLLLEKAIEQSVLFTSKRDEELNLTEEELKEILYKNGF